MNSAGVQAKLEVDRISNFLYYALDSYEGDYIWYNENNATDGSQTYVIELDRAQKTLNFYLEDDNKEWVELVPYSFYLDWLEAGEEDLHFAVTFNGNDQEVRLQEVDYIADGITRPVKQSVCDTTDMVVKQMSQDHHDRARADATASGICDYANVWHANGWDYYDANWGLIDEHFTIMTDQPADDDEAY